MKFILKASLVLGLLLGSLSPAYALTHLVTGVVTKVIDGDTLDLNANGKLYRVRLEAIDAPESTQDYGYQAKAVLAKQVLNKKVKVTVSGTDRYKRTIGTVYLMSGENVNENMIKYGLAWDYTYYSKGLYQRVQAIAKVKRLGLWKDKSPIPPWEYRKKN